VETKTVNVEMNFIQVIPPKIGLYSKRTFAKNTKQLFIYMTFLTHINNSETRDNIINVKNYYHQVYSLIKTIRKQSLTLILKIYNHKLEGSELTEKKRKSMVTIEPNK